MSTTNYELVGIPNLAGLSIATISAGSSAGSGWGVANLGTDEPSERWRSAGLQSEQTGIYFTTGDLAVLDADRFGLVNHNLLSGSGLMRVVGQTKAGIYINDSFNVALPISFPDKSGTTGLVTSVDEGTVPAGDWIGPSSIGDPWYVRVRFATVSGALSAGSKRQQFWAYVKASAAGVSAPCFVEAELYRNGVALGSLGRKCITSMTGQWMFWGWNSSLVADGTTIEVLLSFSPGAAGDPYLDSVYWLHELSADVDTVAEKCLDTGWVAYSEAQAAGFGTNYPEAAGATRNMILSGTPSADMKSLWVLLRDDHAPAGLDVSTTIPIAPPGYLQAGCLVVAKGWRSSIGVPRAGDMVRVVDPSSSGRTRGGQTYGSRLRPYREFTLPLDFLTDAEARGLLERLLLLHGTRVPLLVRIRPDDANWSHLGTAWCELSDPGSVGEALATAYPRRAVLNFREKL